MTEVEHSGEVSQETDDMVIYLKLASDHTLTIQPPGKEEQGLDMDLTTGLKSSQRNMNKHHCSNL